MENKSFGIVRGKQSRQLKVSRKTIVAAAEFDFMRDGPPSTEEERRVYSANTTERIEAILKGRLSRTELALWGKGEPDSNCWRKCDQVIIELAATLGTRIFWCSNVLARIQQWYERDDAGPARLKELFRTLERGTQVTRGTARHPHPLKSPEHYQAKVETSKEVRALTKKFRAPFVGSQKPPSAAELREMVRVEIETLPNAYPYLFENRRSFLRYLELQDYEQEGNPLSKRLAMGEATVSEIVDGWDDWSFNTGEGRSRKIISGLGSRKRRV